VIEGEKKLDREQQAKGQRLRLRCKGVVLREREREREREEKKIYGVKERQKKNMKIDFFTSHYLTSTL